MVKEFKDLKINDIITLRSNNSPYKVVNITDEGERLRIDIEGVKTLDKQSFCPKKDADINVNWK